jgi:hypothetical protein
MFLPIPTKGQRSGVVFSGVPMAGAGLLFWNVGPETKALGFSNAINFPALWTWRQDDELAIDNQGFWFRRGREELPEYRAIEMLNSTKGSDGATGGCKAGPSEMPHCSNSAA